MAIYSRKFFAFAELSVERLYLWALGPTSTRLVSQMVGGAWPLAPPPPPPGSYTYAEHIVYGGEVIKIWLFLIAFSHLKFLSECMKVGLVIPVYKRQGKDPLLINSYQGIILSSVLSKAFEIILLQ